MSLHTLGRRTIPGHENTTRIQAHAEARQLVLTFGWNTTAYQILNPGFQLWFSRTHPGMVGYVHAWRQRVVGGAPVCAAEHLADVAEEFEHDAARCGERVVYFGAEERLEQLYQNSAEHTKIVLGAQPVWTPSHWDLLVTRHASLRAQFNRARHKGVRVEVWAPEVAEQHAGLRQCLDEWLSTRPLPPLHFLVEPDTLGDVSDRMVIVATRDETPVGFVVASPVPTRQGWLVEQFVRGHGAPNGTAELMIDMAVRTMASQGAHEVTLGLAPLSRRAEVVQAEPVWLRLVFDWVHAHGRRFYNFDGLDAFKAKFHPERWDPVYVIANEPRFSPISLHAIASAFTNDAPFRTVTLGMARAVWQEVRWLGEP